ncbi:unnamed protein product [Acanthosepion pharaonis]|uniref:Uncharacterized protein n=1 Tax=Acanthosepion pharaonis TaxID=158019 RepID=A0A812ALG7_ACAPH|nr:unnamed protein product [Sepia pharaonis]
MYVGRQTRAGIYLSCLPFHILYTSLFFLLSLFLTLSLFRGISLSFIKSTFLLHPLFSQMIVLLLTIEDYSPPFSVFEISSLRCFLKLSHPLTICFPLFSVFRLPAFYPCHSLSTLSFFSSLSISPDFYAYFFHHLFKSFVFLHLKFLQCNCLTFSFSTHSFKFIPIFSLCISFYVLEANVKETLPHIFTRRSELPVFRHVLFLCFGWWLPQ